MRIFAPFGKKHLLVILIVLLAGCASMQEDNQVEVNPAEFCRSLGLEESTEEFGNCVNNQIQRYCMSQGLNPGSPDYAQCESNVKDATFLRQQLHIRGY